MQTQLQTCLFLKNQIIYLPLFGYSSRSVPGLEINGIGKLGKNIKEKIIYVSKTYGIKSSTKKYVLCLDQQMGLEDSTVTTYQNLELPLFLMYLYLTGNFPMNKLDNCFASGVITPGGRMKDMLPKLIPEKFILLHIDNHPSCLADNRLDLKEIISHFKSIESVPDQETC
jgi:hypothetical protein